MNRESEPESDSNTNYRSSKQPSEEKGKKHSLSEESIYKNRNQE